MATYPIKVLLDRNRQPFIPFATTSSIVENGTNRRLDKILGNLDDLQTNNKNSLVSAINEILTQHGSGGSSTGWQVVDVLPTENISATTIYLLPKEGATKPNIYEEWIWVNEDWESIGTTEIDLSGYATTTMIGDLNTLQTTDKDSVVDAINELVNTTGDLSGDVNNKQDTLTAGENISIENNVISVSGVPLPIYAVYTTKAYTQDNTYMSNEDKAQVHAALADAREKGYTAIKLMLVTNAWGRVYTFDIPVIPASGNLYYGLAPYDMNGTFFAKVALSFQTVDDETHEAAFIIFKVYSSSEYILYKNNTAEFTPTSNYHPATKKYVDDAIAAAGTGSGSAFDPAKYLAIDNTTEYTPTDLYHPATKAYVDSQIASVPEPVDAYSKTEIDGKLDNYLSKTNTESYTPTSDYHPATKKFVESVVASIPGPDLSSYYTKNETDTLLNNKVDCSGYDVDVKATYEEMSMIREEMMNIADNTLSKTNTTSYTPTGDYNPATKKYVDDAVADVSGESVDLSGYYTKDEVDTFLSRQNTRFYFSNPNVALAVTNEFQDITIYNSSDTAVERWATGKIENGTDDKLCVYTAKIGRPHYLEVTITYQADDSLVFGNYDSLLYWHRLEDDGTEVVAGTTISQYTPADRGDYHVVKYLVYLMGAETTSDIYLKRTSNMKCGTKDSTTIYDLEVTVVPWLPF